jgi:predicted nucleic acid-binding Zn ribbon protein
VWQVVPAICASGRCFAPTISKTDSLAGWETPRGNRYHHASRFFIAAAFAAVLAMQRSAPALTLTECSAKYKDAKAAGTLKGAGWNDFRKSQCDLASAKRSASAPGSDVTVVAANAVHRRRSGTRARPAQDLSRSVQDQ